MKNNFRKAALSTICMLIVAVMSLTGVTYAWFTAGEQATVNGMNVVVSTAEGGIQVREQGSENWQTTLSLGVNETNIKPISSADGKKFFTTGEYNALNSNQAKIVEVTSADSYYSNVITKTIELYNPGQTVFNVDLSGSEIKAGTGGVNNEIYKAARVALFVTVGGVTTPYIWAGETSDSANAFVAASDTYQTLNTAIEDIAVATATKTNTQCTIALPANPNATADGIVTVQIVMWLEGQDLDCTNGNAGGAFDVVLNFKKVAGN